MTMNEFTYIGTELELFAKAVNWKNYCKRLLQKYLKGSVLEVGAGMGTNTQLLMDNRYEQWLCLEPDAQLFNLLETAIFNQNLSHCSAQKGTIDQLSEQQKFDAILYIDVLEHIEEDYAEVSKASVHLNPNGNLIILGPAHQWLFTPFDSAIGHYRRYDKPSLLKLLPPDMEVVTVGYLDCVGLLASLANKLFLKQSQPTLKQIQLWDQKMVPISQKLDPLIRYQWGKSLLLVARKK